VTNVDKAKTLGDALTRVTDVHVCMSLALQQAFGLRREESIKFQPNYADRGDCIVLKGSWTKGGRERAVPITTAEQRIVLDQAHQLAGAGSLIPAHKTYIQQRHTYDGQCKAAALSHMHGLRHHYAQTRYEALTGWRAPAVSGPSARALTPTLAGVNYFFRRIASLDLLPGMGHCLTAIVTEGNGDGRQKWHEHFRGRGGRN
jgi:Integrase